MRLIKFGILLIVLGAPLGLTALMAQQAAAPAATELKAWTTQEDHQNMMTSAGNQEAAAGPERK